MMRTVCEQPECGERLPVAGRGPMPKYCSIRCRKAAYRARQAERNASALPQEMTDRRRWVRRDADKRPRMLDGGLASVAAPGTWASYAEACSATVGAGLGFVLADRDGLLCVDLDHCIDDEGQVAEWAREILDRCPRTFTEVSVSGRGLHIWGRGQVKSGRRIRRDGMAIEVYGHGRYIAVTGNRFEDAPRWLADLGPVIDDLI
ncbi:bifunctional DNA primase/polymerase [Streptomyces sp. TRM66268-LWL]|uniref:Bifunctional DNA primase/polymerase n=1 Tax=Streptomyces polyasparticus TaxID=2767826 RepID=A0ABR7SVT5_9ACTN|nr:bifunctional DNA primase/polymerase [Streptomyces polyasparticus]MBC9719508.1 bifunctional DNA primase/polymerase [Streptomyces polyasparticus]